VEIASAVETKDLPVDPNFKKIRPLLLTKIIIIHDKPIPNPFTQKTVNNFNLLTPFGRLYEIFNYLIYHSSDYDKLAAYMSFEYHQGILLSYL